MKAIEHVQTSMEPAAHEQTVLKSLKESTFGKNSELGRKRKRVKGPNPLSCKKRKTKDQSARDSGNPRKRKRKRSRKRAKTNLSPALQLTPSG